MFLLIFYLSLALGVSFFCSILEAVILSVTPSYIEAMEQKSPSTGAALRQLKSNINRSLAAILSLNTIAHTVGAAGVGAQALVVFGSGYVAVTSAILTFLILVLSEIVPKTIGAFYWQKLAVSTTRILPILIWFMYPLVLLSQKISGWLASETSVSVISREELHSMTDLARKKGLFTERESRILKNLIWVGRLKVKDIMTPRPVMFALPSSMTVGEVLKEYPEIRFSRIPVFDTGRDDIHTFVLKNDIMSRASQEHHDTKLCSFARDVTMVPELATLISVFEQFLNSREHVAVAIDEFGGVAGIVTMEDIVETLLGIEIVDETDLAVDMQALARQQWTKRARALGLIPTEDE